MSDHHHPPGAQLRPVGEHAARVAGLLSAMPVETVRIADALGRTLARDVIAPHSLPGFDNSAMDGYAVRAADVTGATGQSPVELVVAEDIPAGRVDRLRLAPHTAHRIMTGAPVPENADAVVQVELTDGGTETVAVHRGVEVGASIRRAGSDIAAWDLALAAGTALHSAQIGLLAALGLTEAEVPRRAHVVVLSTGTELVPPGETLQHGQIHESNGVMLCAAVRSAGALATHVALVPDDVAAFRTRLDAIVGQADPPVDLLLTSGGVSAGAYEVVKDALGGPGSEVEFVKVAMQPGMPQGSGRYVTPDGATVPIVTLPGNPVSAQVSFEVFVRPPLRASMRLPEHRARTVARLTDDLRSPFSKRQFRRGVVETASDGTAVVHPIGPPSSHHLRYLASANALLDVGEDVTELPRGSSVEVMLIDDAR